MLIQNFQNEQTDIVVHTYNCSPQGAEEETRHRFEASLGYRVKSCGEEGETKQQNNTKHNQTKTTCLIHLLRPDNKQTNKQGKKEKKRPSLLMLATLLALLQPTMEKFSQWAHLGGFAQHCLKSADEPSLDYYTSCPPFRQGKFPSM